MSLFTDGIARVAHSVATGLHHGDPQNLDVTSWHDIAYAGRQVTTVLQAAGVHPGHRVAALAAGAQDVAPVVQGVWGAGAALTMLQQPTPQADLGDWHTATLRTLEMLDAHVVVVGEPFLAVEPLLARAGYRTVIVPARWDADPTEPLSPAEDDVALYQLTSGSTGAPKAVAITHANLYASAAAMYAGAAADSESDVMVSWLPLSHDMGMVGFLLAPMHFGFKAVYISPAEFLKSPMTWIALLSEHRGTMTSAPNFAYSIVHRRMKAIDDGAYDLSALRFALCGAEPVASSTMTEFTRQAGRFGMNPSAVLAAYGLAEATLAVSFSRIDEGLRIERIDAEDFERHRRATPVSGSGDTTKELVLVGSVLPGFTVKVIDDAGAALPPRHLGEILVASHAVTKRYLTADGEVSAVDHDGWLHTGDLGYLTETGDLAVCGRLKNIIIVAGRNIFPSEVERIAETADGIRRGGVVAFGVELPDGREEITVVAETVADYDDDTRRQIRRQVARSIFSIIGLSPNVVLTARGTIPKTPSGKIRHVEAKRIFVEAK